MRSSVRIRWSYILPYIFLVLLIHLARFYIGGIFNYLYFILLILPPVSLLQVTVALVGIKYYQTFSTDHPTKGQILTYTLSVANESFLPSVPIRIRFKTIQPGIEKHIPDLTTTLRMGERFQQEYEISCPYRGIYTVGLERMEVFDLLGWITIDRKVWHRTFYVYPRIIDAEYPFSIGNTSNLSTGPNPGASQDYSLFESLATYREGQSVRHMAWKKFISLGQPYLKSYGRTSQPGVSVYLDLRRDEELSPTLLEREDCSIEIVVALAKYCLDRSIPVSINAMGRSRYSFVATDSAEFLTFHRDTVNILFHDTISPAELYRSDLHGSASVTSVVFVTHVLDPEVLSIVENNIGTGAEGETAVSAIFNQSTLTEALRVDSKTYFNSIREKGGKVAVVGSSDSIPEDFQLTT